MSRADQILKLRELIKLQNPAPTQAQQSLATGIARLDALLDGGLRKGGLIELTAQGPASGTSLLMRAILERAAAQGRWMALIDGSDSFDPQSAREELLESLLWLRCRTAREALRCADLLLRDGNLPLLFLDLRGNCAAELRKIPDTTWYRFQRILAPTAVALVVLTSQALIGSAHVRILVESRFGLDDLGREPDSLLQELTLRLTRNRSFSTGAPREALA